ncbi:uncharacterized protein M6B38_181985 [Iris pallida]|uniref:Uncharacterized protein n=1 Tax=Iris pallida TaxID=29817 RepID=A0AAX6ELN5_IRIPA|nr:uncharacterized protein M6B38_181980 [Iris pallida]KAJ6805063.1 uncharacterized protein M6B38_181985 [Iris pallida]
MSSALLKLTAHGIPLPQTSTTSSNPSLTAFPIASLRRSSPSRFARVSLSAQRKATNGEEAVNDAGELRQRSVDPNGGDGSRNAKAFSTKELLQSLKTYGVAGVLSYGLLNTLYYLTTFLLVWFYFAPAPGKMGYRAAVERFLKVMAMVWAGSQVTKIARAGGALMMAPFVDRGLSWFTIKFKFESKGKAFAAIAGMCFGLAALLFFGLTLLWA